MSHAGEACLGCLRRGALIGRLAPGIAGLLRRRSARHAGLLALDDADLVAAVAGGRESATMTWLERFDEREARAAIAARGLTCMCRHSGSYPSQLLDLPDPPAALYVAGDPELIAALGREPGVTIVGGRSATEYALEVAEALGRRLAVAGVTVVSGLALGVDARAHRGSRGGGGPAVAVLASGPDIPNPAANRTLYGWVRAHGAVVSELPPGTPPMRWGFPARNRIMAALGRLTVVVEAREGSGSLITAAFASDLGREVGAVPGRVTTGHAAGSNRLLHEGARVVRCAEDVVDELYGVGVGRRLLSADAGAAAALVRDLDRDVRRVLEAVEGGLGVEAIGPAVGLAPAGVRAALGRLELLGLIRRGGLGAYERSAER